MDIFSDLLNVFYHFKTCFQEKFTCFLLAQLLAYYKQKSSDVFFTCF